MLDTKPNVVQLFYNDNSMFRFDMKQCTFDGIHLNGVITITCKNVDIDDSRELFEECLIEF